MKHYSKYKKQNGFSILAIILVIVAVVVAIGIWAISGQTNTSNMSNNSSSIQASAIINDANQIKMGFNYLIINGNKVEKIIFAPSGTYGYGTNEPNILDISTGATMPIVNKNSIKSNHEDYEGKWGYGKFRIKNVGIEENPDYVIVLNSVKDSVCKEINKSIYNKYEIFAYNYQENVNILGEWSYTNMFDGVYNLNTYAPTIDGMTSACFGAIPATPDENTFFLVLKAN